MRPAWMSPPPRYERRLRRSMCPVPGWPRRSDWRPARHPRAPSAWPWSWLLSCCSREPSSTARGCAYPPARPWCGLRRLTRCGDAAGTSPRKAAASNGEVSRTEPLRLAAEVARRDRVMASLIKRTSPFHLPRRSTGHFAALAESILHQQLAGAAARAIHGRFVALFDGDLTPAAVLAVPPRKLRAAGLSGRKVASIRDLAAKVVDGTVPLDRIGRLADEDVITRLSVVRGIGRWTAEMFLIFQLRRLDVWPVGDYGIRKGYALAYDLRKLPTPKQLEGEGERFRPYRTVAAWYCWQAVREQRKLRQ